MKSLTISCGLLLVLALALPVGAEEIYVIQGKNGPTFTNKPEAGAKPVGLPALSVVPAVAVVARPAGGHYVWVYQPDRGVVVERDVQIGALTSDGLQVTAGLESGAIIVIRGVHQLQSGMPVRLLPRREDAQ